MPPRSWASRLPLSSVACLSLDTRAYTTQTFAASGGMLVLRVICCSPSPSCSSRCVWPHRRVLFTQRHHADAERLRQLRDRDDVDGLAAFRTTHRACCHSSLVC